MKRIRKFYDIVLSIFFALAAIVTISGVMFFTIHIALIKSDILLGCIVEFILLKLFAHDSDSRGKK